MAFDNDNPSTKKSFYRRPADADPKREGEDFRPRPVTERKRSDKSKPAFDKKAERKAPENVIFGIHPVREAIEAGTEIEKIYFRKTAGETLAAAERAHVGAANALREQALEADIHIQEVPVEKLNRLTRNGNHQGVAAVVAAISYKDINELAEELETKIAAGETPLVMLMDSVTDVRNFGAIARSAECAGAAALIMPAKNSAPVNAEAIKSSAGALTLIPVCRAGSLKGAIALLKGIGMQCVAATEKSNTLVYEVDFTKPTVIVMGAEDKGISREVLRLCDVEAGIPLVGRIESLNVSAAAAVILFEAQRQRFERQ
ncbi:23S rRNA (guanosine(2251)-2'-O)-methyltransferase RlmB [uncultured Rikenella sp.]|uniref:23S rRNA (guanosine(2251)-2'-O)-methyltransferase RlmB n=1 Tax=uncultured Rikenella sp. TaxID=368003 RepID=UPI002639B53C|nr:23S rRNA (guanosine(2251)-2'-O)-methyltransferase RlmB [uncultured Rikenella sp.]